MVISVFDYSSIIENGESIRNMISETLSKNDLQMKMCFVVKL